MNILNKPLKTLVIAGGLSCAMVAGASQGLSHAVFTEIQVMDYSLNSSSISQHLAKEKLAYSNRQLERAVELAKAGQFRTAEELVRRVGQQIYSMDRPDRLSGYDSERIWVEEMAVAFESLLPPAREIAASKARAEDEIAEHVAVYEYGVAALEEGNLGAARTLIEIAYLGLQRTVVDLRSGDRLVIELPDPGTQAAWLDAQRRYQDWVYTTQSLIEQYPVAGDNLVRVQQVLDEAQLHYEMAGQLAGVQDWERAVLTLDDAFNLMEDSWRQLGIEI